MSSEEVINGYFCLIPNEIIIPILKRLSLNDLLNLSITNKRFRDLITHHLFESSDGLTSLLGENISAKNSITSEQKHRRTEVFSKLGILLRRIKWFSPTKEKIQILIETFNRLDGIPSISFNEVNNENMRFVFQCFGYFVRHYINGWKNSELKLIFKTLSKIAKVEDYINFIVLYPFKDFNDSYEYYIHCFYRMVFIDPNRTLPSNDNIFVFWLNLILEKRSLQMRARLLLILFSPFKYRSLIPSIVYSIDYFHFNEREFIPQNLYELGNAVRLMFSEYYLNDTNNQMNIISLFDTIVNFPEVWLPENVGSLLFSCGPEFTFEYLFLKLEKGLYKEVSQKLVFLSLVIYKLTETTKYVSDLIIDLAKGEHKTLFKEINIAIIEISNEINVGFKLKELVEVMNDLLFHFMEKH